MVLQTIGFDYSSLALPERARLRSHGEAVRSLQRQAAASSVKIGGILAEVRETLGHGRFTAWIGTEFCWSRSTAYRFIAVWEAFGGVHSSHVGTFEPSALYELSQPNVPQSAREYAVELAADGRRVTLAEAREILDAYKPVAVESKDLPKLAPIRPADRSGAVPPPPPVPADNPAWSALLGLVAGRATLHLSVTEGDEYDNDGQVIAGTYYPGGDGDRPRYAVRRSVEEVLLELAGREAEKACLRCKLTLPASAFCRDAGRADGRLIYCKTCERSRSRSAKEARKTSAATPTATAAPGRA